MPKKDQSLKHGISLLDEESKEQEVIRILKDMPLNIRRNFIGLLKAIDKLK